jgi:hypothetical protein
MATAEEEAAATRNPEARAEGVAAEAEPATEETVVETVPKDALAALLLQKVEQKAANAAQEVRLTAEMKEKMDTGLRINPALAQNAARQTGRKEGGRSKHALAIRHPPSPRTSSGLLTISTSSTGRPWEGREARPPARRLLRSHPRFGAERRALIKNGELNLLDREPCGGSVIGKA